MRLQLQVKKVESKGSLVQQIQSQTNLTFIEYLAKYCVKTCCLSLMCIASIHILIGYTDSHVFHLRSRTCCNASFQILLIPKIRGIAPSMRCLSVCLLSVSGRLVAVANPAPLLHQSRTSTMLHLTSMSCPSMRPAPYLRSGSRTPPAPITRNAGKNLVSYTGTFLLGAPRRVA